VLGGGQPDLVFEARQDGAYGRPVFRRIVDGDAQALVTEDGVPDPAFERALTVIAARLVAGDFTVDTNDTQD
jgi:hypothetical protein